MMEINENKLLKMLEQETDLNKCTFKVYLDKGILNKDDNEHCNRCDGMGSGSLCKYFCSINHYLHFYECLRYGVRK